jgi:cyanate lyase
MERTQLIEDMLAVKSRKAISYADLAAAMGRHRIWLASAMLGHAQLTEAEARILLQYLGFAASPDEIACLRQPPQRGAVAAIPAEPLLYRLFEIIHVHGPAIQAVIQEEFGDGIMSAVDLEIDIKRLSDPAGDRVQLTCNGKFLPYRTW